ncbi:MAG: alpha/beta hydrolase, partial [Actinomycetota bacterium]|nr:alpha/beta hydrolase [Actinomycetota bacterium]
MSRRALPLLLGPPLLILAFALAALHAPAAVALPFSPCTNSPGFACASVPVPLDRSGRVPGVISLSVQRKAAAAGPSQSAVLALAGGPGQAMLPLGEFVARELAPALGARDLLLFDQRGTGESDPLSCNALRVQSASAVGKLVERCALEIGPARGAYTTAESVADIEAVRRAGGYQRLTLYGTSYGTKVALQYAQRYPEHVESLLLDSVVPADGPEPFMVRTFQAIKPVLGELCANRACAGITPSPLRDLAALAARLRRHALGGSAYDGSGRRSPSAISESGMLDILQAGDLNPALRALLPAAVRSALHHDPDPLLRLHLLSQGLIPSVPKQPLEGSPSIDETLFVTTSCEELPFPWQRAASATTRLAEALAALHALPGGDFAPFDASTALANGLIPGCVYWPDASAPSAPSAPLPNVPTLILSGAQDLRTPTSSARQVASQIPDAQLLVVPYTGHSVLGSDFSGCAQAAVSAFFAGNPLRSCSATPDLFSPTPVAPRKLA